MYFFILFSICFYQLFYTYLALIQKRVWWLKIHISNWRSGNLQPLSGRGHDTFVQVVPIHPIVGPSCQRHARRDLALLRSLQVVSHPHPNLRKLDLMILRSTSWGDYREYLGMCWVSWKWRTSSEPLMCLLGPERGSLWSRPNRHLYRKFSL